MRKNILAVVNPLSANGRTGQEWIAIEEEIRNAGIDFNFKYTRYPLHATEIVRGALKSNYDTILSVGGDGTMNEVVNGFFEKDRIIKKDSYLLIFAKGTGCDFSRTLNTGRNTSEIIKALSRMNIIESDIGKVQYTKSSGERGCRYFLNISDMGIGGETTYWVNKNSKILKGFLSFLIGATYSILTFKNKDFVITIDDEIIISGKKSCLVIANGKYFGGGMLVAPNAKIDDGLMDIILIGDFKKFELISNFPRIYKGTHLSHPKVESYRAKKIKVEVLKSVFIELDGEQFKIVNADFEILPKSLNLLV